MPALKVGRSAYYAYLAARPAVEARQEAEEELAGEIRQIHASSRGAYGAPRVTAALRRTGRRINRKKVERIMRERDIHGITRCKRRNLTKADTKAAPSADLVGRDFTAVEPGTKLVSDITYLPTLAGWWYLATVIDLATREVIGYAMADHHRAELVVGALEMAAGRGNLKETCIAHSDRGSEGGFNWSSQHLDHGGMRWDETRSRRCRRRLRERDGSGRRIGRCDRRCVHRVGRSRLVQCSATSGGGSRRE
ncbi:IS3 family transposase [Streptomyces sp. NPDC058286]|uniref:IS3 family transposase n=1 Tax=Streptomyces sp. NPDC058286 TaxID=3346422 RepID=UPI0036E3CB2D